MSQTSRLIHRVIEPINVAAFEEQMVLSQRSLNRLDTTAAYRHLERAHAIAHESLPQHIQVHRAMLSAAAMDRKAGRIMAELYSMIVLSFMRRFLRQ